MEEGDVNRWTIAEGYELREVPAEEFRSFLTEHRPRLLGGDFSCMPEEYLSDDEKRAQEQLADRMGNLFRLRLGVFYNGSQVGWSFGTQLDRGKFYMVNSAIFPEHRRKGLYKSMLEKAVGIVAAQGFQLITSSHIATNSPILIAKLKAGFIITGFELSDVFGLMVNLTYFTNPTRRKIMDFRAGRSRPDADLRRLLGI